MSGGGTMSRASALLSMTSTLGTDVLMPVAVRVEEAISRPFVASVDIVARTAALDRTSLLGQAATLLITRKDGNGNPDTRYVNGIFRRIAATGLSAAGFWGYRAEIVPGLWLLDRVRDCRIYENKTVIDILQALLSKAGLPAASVRTTETPPTRPYTIQYNETALAFASRLLEDEGLFYFFEHTSSAHTMVVADANTAFTPLPRASLQLGSSRGTALDALTGWQPATGMAFAGSELADYDPTAPSKKLDSTTTGSGPGFTRFAWPGRSADPTDLTARSKRRLEASEAEAALIEGGGNDPAFCPGGTFTLPTDPYGGTANLGYVVRGVVHVASDDTWVAGGGATSYANSFTAFPKTVAWREPETTPWPEMTGLFSATVIGPSGQEISTDQYGRVQVQLRFDHTPDATTNGIWLRVVQPWAGNAHGWQHLPRIGSEVAVMFMDGNPDRPVVVGGLFNGTQTPIWAMPDNKSKTGIRTRSTPNGSSDTYSEFSIDDTAGSEMVLLHAEKDLTLETENDRTTTIGHDDTEEVKNDQTLTVDKDRTRTVKGDESVTLQGKQTVAISKDRSVTISGGNDSLEVEQSGTIGIKADGGAITIESGQSITLKVGDNSVAISTSGISINGIQISVQGTAKVAAAGPMVQVNADATLTLKGGIVMVN